MKKFLASLCAALSFVGFFSSAEAGGWTIVPKDRETNTPYFLLKYDGKDAGKIRPSLGDTPPSLQVSKNAANWLVSYFAPSDSDVDAMKNPKTSTWSAETQHGPAILRGHSNGAGRSSAFPTTLNLTFEKLKGWPASMDKGQWDALKAALVAYKEKFKLTSMTDFNDSDKLAKSEVAKLCQNCFTFE